MNNMLRHMIYHDSSLNYNTIALQLKIKVKEADKKQIQEIFKTMKKDNFEIIGEAPYTSIISSFEIILDNVVNRKNVEFNREHNEIIHTAYDKMKTDYSEILNVLSLYLIPVEKVDYEENYFVRK